MGAEGAGPVMVLPVDVVGDGAAERDEARAGRDRQEPALRQRHVDDGGEENARLGADDARLEVEIEDAVERAAVEDDATVVEARVAVAPAIAIRKQRPRIAVIDRQDGREPRHRPRFLRDAREAAPGRGRRASTRRRAWCACV
jgi:hypothetical protein